MTPALSAPTAETVALGSGIYLFCCARPAVTAVLDTDGLEPGQPLCAVRRGGLVAVTCAVPLADWVGPLGEAHLGDLAWLGPRALRHEAVIERAMAVAPLLPLPLGTLFSSQAVLLQWLDERDSRIGQFLDVIADKEEWSLKGVVDTQRAESQLLAADPRLTRLPAGGARYLLEKRLRADAALQVRKDAKQAESELLGQLGGLTLCRRVRRVLGTPAKDAPQVIFHSALLILASQRAALAAQVAAFNATRADHELSVELSGPWPPSSFVPNMAVEEDENGTA